MYTGIIHNSTQEVMVKIVADKSKYFANPDFKRQMKKNPNLLIGLLSM